MLPDKSNPKKYLNPIALFIKRHKKFLNDIKNKHKRTDEGTNVQEYLRPIYLETLECLYKIFKKADLGRSEMTQLLGRACLLKSFENYIVEHLFLNKSEKGNIFERNEKEISRRNQFLEEILLEYDRRKLNSNERDEEKIKKTLIRDCMKYIIYRIHKRINYIYKIKAKLNNINLKNDVRKRRGTGRKLKFIRHLHTVIDKCCINLIHMTLKEALPMVHDVHVVLRKVLSNNYSDNISSVIQATNDMSELRNENIQNDSLLYTWFLVLFSVIRLKNVAEADKKRDELVQDYLDAGNAKANDYANKKTSMKFLQNRIRKLLGNINNFKLKYEWERLRKGRLIHRVYKKKLQEDTEDYKTHFEAAVMSTIPRILKSRVAVRCLFKLVCGTEVDAADPKYLEKMQQEREEKEEEAEKKKKEKKKKTGEPEELDIKDVIRDVFMETSDKVYELYEGVDTILTNLMAQTNRSYYLQRDAKVAMRKYITETRRSAGLAPFKPAARKKLMYNIHYNKNLPKDLRIIMKKQVNCLHRMSRHQKKFRRTFKRFRKCNADENLKKNPPPLEVVHKKWEKRSYERRLRRGYRKKTHFFPKFQFMFVEEPKVIRAKTRERKRAAEYISTYQRETAKEKQGKVHEENIYRRKIYKPKRKGPDVWTSKIYKQIQKEFDNERRSRRDPLNEFKEKTPSQCDLARLNKWNFIGDVLNTHKKFIPKDDPDIGKYIKGLLDKNKRYQMKTYIKQKKEHQQFCDNHDFRQKRHMECEVQIPEVILTGNVKAVKRIRTLKMIKELMLRKQLEDELKDNDTSDEELQEVKHIIRRKRDAELWCNEHENTLRTSTQDN